MGRLSKTKKNVKEVLLKDNKARYDGNNETIISYYKEFHNIDISAIRYLEPVESITRAKRWLKKNDEEFMQCIEFYDDNIELQNEYIEAFARRATSKLKNGD